MSNTPSVDDGLPLHQVVLADGTQALDARLILLLSAPCIQFLY